MEKNYTIRVFIISTLQKIFKAANKSRSTRSVAHTTYANRISVKNLKGRDHLTDKDVVERMIFINLQCLYCLHPVVVYDKVL
jgi:hypothetical protein